MNILAEAVLGNLHDGKSVDQCWDSIKQLREELQPASGESQELERLLTDMRKRFPIGTIVDIRYTGYTGEIISYNTNLGGFYPGIRYPLKIKIIKKDPKCKHDVIDSIFEYGPDQLFILKHLEQAFADVDMNLPPTSDDIEYVKCYRYWLNL